MNPGGLHIPSLDQVLAALDGSPVGLYLIPTIALVSGAFLWAAGGRALKPLFVLIAVVSGAVLGLNHLTPLFAGHLGDVPPHYAGIGFGALGGLLLAVAFFRALMGIAAGITLAAVALAIAAAAMGLRAADFAPTETSPARPSTVSADPAALYERAVIVYGGKTPPLVQPEPRRAHPELRTAAAQPGELAAGELAPTSPIEAARARAIESWNALPDRARHNLAAAALAGAVLGLVIGILAPKKSAALVTASLGAGLMLAAAALLIRTLEPGHAARNLLALLDQRGPGAWLAVWGVLAVLGLAIQGRRGRKPAAKPQA